MQKTFITTGAIADKKTVTLDEPLPAGSGRVRVTVEMLPSQAPSNLQKFMEQMWEEQKSRGHKPRTHEQVVSELNAERDSWGD